MSVLDFPSNAKVVDEHECQNLHEVMEFSITAFAYNTGAKELEVWFSTALKVNEPEIASNFSLDVSEFEGSPILEIMAHDSGFPTTALISLFYAHRDK